MIHNMGGLGDRLGHMCVAYRRLAQAQQTAPATRTPGLPVALRGCVKSFVPLPMPLPSYCRIPSVNPTIYLSIYMISLDAGTRLKKKKKRAIRWEYTWLWFDVTRRHNTEGGNRGTMPHDGDVGEARLFSSILVIGAVSTRVSAPSKRWRPVRVRPSELTSVLCRARL